MDPFFMSCLRITVGYHFPEHRSPMPKHEMAPKKADAKKSKADAKTKKSNRGGGRTYTDAQCVGQGG